MTDIYHHGVKIVEVAKIDNSIKTIETSVIGLIATAPKADSTKYPLNKPLKIEDLKTAATELGDTGTAAAAIKTLADQSQPLIILVLVAEKAVASEQAVEVIGSNKNGVAKGLECFKSAKSVLGLMPRILIAPALDFQKVAVEMVATAKFLRAFCYLTSRKTANAGGVGDALASSKEDAATYAAQFSAREAMVLFPNFKFYDVYKDTTTTIDAVSVAAGLRASLDNTIGWHKTLSNVVVKGVNGITVPLSWDLQNSETDANWLNERKVTALINNQGFRFWGSRTVSDDANFIFENYTRGAQVLADTMAQGHFWAVDKPLTPVLVKDIVSGINQKLKSFVAAGYLLGAVAWVDEQANTKDSLKTGTFNINYKYTPVPPLEKLNLQQEITDAYIVDFT